MQYMDESALFEDHPVTWLDWQAGSWVHRGHVGVATFDQQLRDPLGPQFDSLEALPETLTHEWMRFAEHDPNAGCDDDYCDCEAAEYPDYLWSEKAADGDEGAIPVTVAFARLRAC